MAVKQRVTGRAASIPAGIALGILVSIMITLLGAAAAACLIANESLEENAVGYCSLVTLLVAAAAGAFVSMSMIKRLRLQMCLLSGLCYYLSLLAITALFFGGQYEGMGVSAIVVLAGSGIAILPSIIRPKGRKMQLKKKGYR